MTMTKDEVTIVDFWQDIEDCAYIIDGEDADSKRARLQHFLAHLPWPDPIDSIEDFRRYVARHLLVLWLETLGGTDPLRGTKLPELREMPDDDMPF
jgi:hypothetical protein